MNAKKTLTTLCTTAAVNLLAYTGAYAAPSTHTVYSSGLLVLLFLGFCALVVVAQLIPALITLCGMIKGALANKNTEAAEVARH